MNENNKKHESDTWAAEEARQERKERLAQQKDQSGNKKPIKAKGRGRRLVAIALAVAILLGFFAWFADSMGLRQRHSKAFTVAYDAEASQDKGNKEQATAAEATEGELKGEAIGSVSVAEANIYLGLVSQQFLQGGAFSQTGQDMLSKPSQFNPNGTLRDDMLLTIENQAKVATYLWWKATQEGYELDEADAQNLDMIIQQYSSIASQSQVTLSHYLSVMFGPGVNEKVFREFFSKNQLGNKYYRDVYAGFTYDDATIDAKYEADPDNYNRVDFRSYLFTAEVPENKTDDTKAASGETADKAKDQAENQEKEPDKAKAKADADAFAAQVKDAEDFKKQAAVLDSKKAAQDKNDQQAQAKQNADSSLTKGARKLNLGGELASWLFAGDRKANDVTVIEEPSGYRVVMFMEKYKPTDIGSYTSRHILFQIKEDDVEKTDEKMKAKAEEVLAQYKAGDQSEEAFAKLATELSDDKASAVNGGLTEDIRPGQFVAEYDKYCTDPARKNGDVEIVKTDYGYHIIYFISSTEQWKTDIIDELRHADEQKFMSDLQAKTSIHREKGIKLFGRP